MTKAQELAEDPGTIHLPAARPRRSPHVIDLRQAQPQRPPARTAVATNTALAARPAQSQPAPAHAPQPSKRNGLWPSSKRQASTQPPRRKLSAKQLASHGVKTLILLAGAVGFLSLNISLPERFIGIYFVAAIVYAIDSQRTFLVALIFLIMVAVWSALGNSVSAGSYAVYAFYFLVIGLASAIREMVFTKPETEPAVLH